MTIRPQPGFQEKFLSSSADIVIGGSGAGVGKTHALLMEPLRHVQVSGFAAVFFRRSYPQIRMSGGIMDKSRGMYPFVGGDFNKSEFTWTFPSGASIKLGQLQYEDTVLEYQGAEICLLLFDELTHFSEYQFFYMLTRNRSTCGVKPYVRATLNPDPDSWVYNLVEWWIDSHTGFPIKEREGVLRYFIKDDTNYIWGSTKDEVKEQAKYIFEANPEAQPDDLIKSITFISGSIFENKELTSKDPSYLANLLSQDETTRERLLNGNWKVKLDGLNLIEYNALNDLFTNTFAAAKPSDQRYITVDPAGMGKDYAVIWVWQGWETIHLSVISQSSPKEIREEVEKLRLRYRVQTSNVMIDADGQVGESLLRSSQYRPYRGGSASVRDNSSNDRTPQNYQNFKTQCTYKFAEKANAGTVFVNINPENCYIDGVKTMKLKRGKEVVHIRDEIKKGLKTLKAKDIDKDGKKRIMSKEEQKVILKRSPDFEDALIIRCAFEFVREPVYLKV